MLSPSAAGSIDTKALINIKKEESAIREKVECLRQLILSSSMKQERILRLDQSLDGIIHNIGYGYTEKFTALTEVGNI